MLTASRRGLCDVTLDLNRLRKVPVLKAWSQDCGAVRKGWSSWEVELPLRVFKLLFRVMTLKRIMGRSLGPLSVSSHTSSITRSCRDALNCHEPRIMGPTGHGQKSQDLSQMSLKLFFF